MIIMIGLTQKDADGVELTTQRSHVTATFYNVPELQDVIEEALNDLLSMNGPVTDISVTVGPR